jgi:hypothetical protein
MPTLSRGQNAPLGGAAPYTVVVTHEPGPDVDLTGSCCAPTAGW